MTDDILDRPVSQFPKSDIFTIAGDTTDISEKYNLPPKKAKRGKLGKNNRTEQIEDVHIVQSELEDGEDNTESQSNLSYEGDQESTPVSGNVCGEPASMFPKPRKSRISNSKLSSKDEKSSELSESYDQNAVTKEISGYHRNENVDKVKHHSNWIHKKQSDETTSTASVGESDEAKNKKNKGRKQKPARDANEKKKRWSWNKKKEDDAGEDDNGNDHSKKNNSDNDSNVVGKKHKRWSRGKKKSDEEDDNEKRKDKPDKGDSNTKKKMPFWKRRKKKDSSEDVEEESEPEDKEEFSNLLNPNKDFIDYLRSKKQNSTVHTFVNTPRTNASRLADRPSVQMMEGLGVVNMSVDDSEMSDIDEVKDLSTDEMNVSNESRELRELKNKLKSANDVFDPKSEKRTRNKKNTSKKEEGGDSRDSVRPIQSHNKHDNQTDKLGVAGNSLFSRIKRRINKKRENSNVSDSEEESDTETVSKDKNMHGTAGKNRRGYKNSDSESDTKNKKKRNKKSDNDGDNKQAKKSKGLRLKLKKHGKDRNVKTDEVQEIFLSNSVESDGSDSDCKIGKRAENLKTKDKKSKAKKIVKLENDTNSDDGHRGKGKQKLKKFKKSNTAVEDSESDDDVKPRKEDRKRKGLSHEQKKFRGQENKRHHNKNSKTENNGECSDDDDNSDESLYSDDDDNDADGSNDGSYNMFTTSTGKEVKSRKMYKAEKENRNDIRLDKKKARKGHEISKDGEHTAKNNKGRKEKGRKPPESSGDSITVSSRGSSLSGDRSPKTLTRKKGGYHLSPSGQEEHASFRDDLSQTPSQESGEDDHPYIPICELYNLINDGDLNNAFIMNPKYLLLIDCRSLEQFHASHIQTAMHHERFISEVLPDSSTDKFSNIVLYDHNGRTYDLTDSALSKLIDQFRAQKLNPVILEGGFDALQMKFPFLCNNLPLNEILSYPLMMLEDLLYLSTNQHCSNEDVINKLAIASVVSISKHSFAFTENVESLKIDDSELPLVNFDASVGFISDAVSRQNCVLVHGGSTDAATVVIASIMFIQKMSLKDAFLVARSKTSIFQLSETYLKNLRKFEKQIWGKKMTDISELAELAT